MFKKVKNISTEIIDEGKKFVEKKFPDKEVQDITKNIKKNKNVLPLKYHKPVTSDIININNYNNIAKKNFKKDISLHSIFVFNQKLLNMPHIYIASLKGINEKNYIVLSSVKERMYKMMLFVCKYKIKPRYVNYGLSSNINPYLNTSSNKNYYYIIFRSDRLSLLKTLILNKLINLYEFKKGFQNLLKKYSEINKKSNFIYNNINFNSLCVNNIGKRKDIIFFDYSYSSDSENKSSKTNKLTPDIQKMIKLFKLDSISNKNNYDIVNSLIIMNISSHYLSNISSRINLDKDEIKELKSNIPLYKKIDILLNNNYFKIL